MVRLDLSSEQSQRMLYCAIVGRGMLIGEDIALVHISATPIHFSLQVANCVIKKFGCELWVNVGD